ncbi:putative acetyltransferase [Gloeomargarita lithophora Alchichica-D10]|uniref:Putative acetyltransferase n=1 Tax=Gloeomargarita lithophora Alchichica-D10 TaxID=1188229 RepID=A0A1J0A989_9CYAN|nr:GNAT family N-acetyltransferase [Gloeomargarita lithophora]APB32504.1 putative acetyltransferase [Gloeomargarita lithophora Alchichica-D10]
MTITFTTDRQKVDVFQLKQLLAIGAFWASQRTLSDLETAIQHSEPVVTAWAGEQLVGFARATSDWVYRAVLWDVVIHPEYRGQGLGRTLVTTILAHPSVQNVERVYLMTSSQQGFYERLGFTENLTTTMVLFNRQPALALPELERLIETSSPLPTP